MGEVCLHCRLVIVMVEAAQGAYGVLFTFIGHLDADLHGTLFCTAVQLYSCTQH